MPRREVDCTYQPMIDGPPFQLPDLYKAACSGDGVTIDTWKDTWIKHYRSAKDKFGSFQEKTIGQLHGINRFKPAIVIGSGPSLKHSLDALRENQNAINPLLTISCLHNLGYFEDEGIKIDYYLSLDSGGVVIEDVSESRNKDGQFYWDQTKGQKLLAFVASDPRLWDLWQGETYLFNCLIPDMKMREEFKKIEPFSHYLSGGGNALGACMYAAKILMGSSTILYVGADFSFDYLDQQFHSYKTNYDHLGTFVECVDVYGNRRKTWPSYLNFKYWFDYVACTVPGLWFNCSEGILGAYRDGNIRQFKYMSLHEALMPFHMADKVFLEKVEGGEAKKEREAFLMKDLWSNSQYEHDLALF